MGMRQAVQLFYSVEMPILLPYCSPNNRLPLASPPFFPSSPTLFFSLTISLFYRSFSGLGLFFSHGFLVNESSWRIDLAHINLKRLNLHRMNFKRTDLAQDLP
jgi:hypothetical protein